MRLYNRGDAQARPPLRDLLPEPVQLLQVIDGAELTGHDDDAAFSAQETPHQLSHQGAARRGIDRDGGKVLDAWRIGVHADDGDAAPDRPAHERGQALRAPRRDDQTVDVVVERGLQGLDLPLAQARIGSVNDPHAVGFERPGDVLDSVPHEVEEGGNLFREIDSHAPLLPRRQEAGREVGPVTNALGQLEDLGPRRLVDARPVVQRPVDGPDGDAEGLRDLPDARWLRALSRFGLPPATQGGLSSYRMPCLNAASVLDRRMERHYCLVNVHGQERNV